MDLTHDLVAALRKREWSDFHALVPGVLRDHADAQWLAVVALSEMKDPGLRGAARARFPVDKPLAVAGHSEGDVTIVLDRMKQEAAAKGQRFECGWARRAGRWERSAREELGLGEEPT
jgi:hypothetical protein